MKEIAPNIVIDQTVRFGKPVIKDTRVTVEEVLGYLAGGMETKEIVDEYGVTREGIQAAVKYAASFLKGEIVGSPQA